MVRLSKSSWFGVRGWMDVFGLDNEVGLWDGFIRLIPGFIILIGGAFSLMIRVGLSGILSSVLNALSDRVSI